MDENTAYNAENDLWFAFRKGDETAFDLIYERLFSTLFNYGYRLCHDEALVKDCIQNVFIEIWQKREQVQEIYSLKHYFLKIMRRKLFKELETRKSVSAKLFDSGAEQENKDISLLNQLDWNNEVSPVTINRIKAAIAKLSDRKKEAILLKFYENLTYAEISEVMGLSNMKYARQLVYRSLDELRKHINQNHPVIGIPVCACFIFLLITVF